MPLPVSSTINSSGKRKGRTPDSFNEAQYLASYGDLRAAFGADGNAATIHYIQDRLRRRANRQAQHRGHPSRRSRLRRGGRPPCRRCRDAQYRRDRPRGRHLYRRVRAGQSVRAQPRRPDHRAATPRSSASTATRCGPIRPGSACPAARRRWRRRCVPAAMPPAWSGKWHLGMKDAYHPQHHGFDEYLRPARHRPSPTFGETAGNPILNGTTPVPASGYLTDTLAAEAAGFIRRRAGQPFFLYVPFSGDSQPSPGQARGAGAARPHRNPKRRLVAAVLASLDEGVGRIMAELQATGWPSGPRSCSSATMAAAPAAIGPCAAARGRFGKAASGCHSSWRGQGWSRPAAPMPSRSCRSTCSPPSCAPPAVRLPGRSMVSMSCHSCAGPAARPTPICSGAVEANGATRKGDWKLVGNELYNLHSDRGDAQRCGHQSSGGGRPAPGTRGLAEDAAAAVVVGEP